MKEISIEWKIRVYGILKFRVKCFTNIVSFEMRLRWYLLS